MKTDILHRGSLLAIVVFCAMSAAGTDFYLKSAATDWSEPSSYCTDSDRTTDATVRPGADDTIYAPAETFTFDSSTAAGLASIETISNVYQILTSDGTILHFNIPSGTAAIGCRIRRDLSSPSTGMTTSTIVKQGGGTLDLSATTATNFNGYLYAANLDVRGGTVKLCQGTTVNQQLGELRLASDTVLWTPCSADKASQVTFAGIKAEENSVITNATTRPSGHAMVVSSTIHMPYESYIRGQVCPNVRIWCVGNMRLEGTNSTTTAETMIQDNYGRFYVDEDGKRTGVILVKSIGTKNSPSSVGVGNSIYAQNNGGGIRYIGTGETANKDFCMAGKSASSSYPNFIDGGPHGGLVMSGSFKFHTQGDSVSEAVRRLWLIGENTNECVINGSVKSETVNDVTYPVFITKSGTGIWRMADNPQCGHKGTVAIREGTLRFDSLRERGLMCSLGDSTICTIDDSRAVTNGDYVPYAFALGGGDHEAVFEYTGAGPAYCTTRPLVLVGDGGRLSASAGAITMHGVSPRDAGTSPTLTLDGSAQGCKLYNVTNGVSGSSVRIEKDGTGSWTLGGNLAVDGGIKVKNGTLSLQTQQTSQSADYKWFRISLAQIGTAGTNDHTCIRKVSLFNANGVRQNGGLAVPSSVRSLRGTGEKTITVVPAEIGKGEIWYDDIYNGKKVKYYSDSGDLDVLCDNEISGTAGKLNLYILTKPDINDELTWYPIVMHLPDSADPIASFDIQGYSKLNVGNFSLPTRVRVEGSHDGTIWKTLYSNTGAEDPLLAQNVSDNNQWISDGSEPIDANTASGNAMSLSSSSGPILTAFSWYRLRVAQLGNSGNKMQIRQIELCDRAGRRVNSGMTLAETPAASGKERTIQGTMPDPGQVGYGYTAAGRRIYVGNQNNELEGSFDNNYSGSTLGKIDIQWKNSDGTACNPTPSDSSTWIPIVMHFAGPTEVHHFDIETLSEKVLDVSPVRFMLEGSYNGEDWHVLYNNATEGVAFSTPPTTYNQWLTDQVVAQSNHPRPAGKGISVSCYADEAEPSYVQFQGGVKAQVLGDGVLAKAGTGVPPVMSELTIDVDDAGAVEGFAFAQDGTLNLLNVDSSMTLPGSYSTCSGLENIRNWTVNVNGKERPGAHVFAHDGTLKLALPGTIVIFR